MVGVLFFIPTQTRSDFSERVLAFNAFFNHTRSGFSRVGLAFYGNAIIPVEL
jgi:hypothetical protein